MMAAVSSQYALSARRGTRSAGCQVQTEPTGPWTPWCPSQTQAAGREPRVQRFKLQIRKPQDLGSDPELGELRPQAQREPSSPFLCHPPVSEVPTDRWCRPLRGGAHACSDSPI